MPDLPVKTRRLLARGVSRRAVPAFSRRNFLGIGDRRAATVSGIHLLSRSTGNVATTFTVAVAGLNTPASVSVVGSAITLNSATDGAGAPTTTRGQAVRLLQGNAAALALVWPSTADPAQTVSAAASTPLA
jgi:hypothetical protein